MKACIVVHKQQTILLCTILAMMKLSCLILLVAAVLFVDFIIDVSVAVCVYCFEFVAKMEFRRIV